MKEIIALVFFSLFVIMTVYLTIKQKITTPVLIIFLSFSLVAGIIISNYDIIKTIRWKDFQLETFEKDVKKVKDDAINDIRKEISNQKQSISLLITNANDTRDKLELQKKEVESLIETIKSTQKIVEVQKKSVESLTAKASMTEKRIQELNKASTDIAKLLIKATYLQIITKSEFGTERATKAINDILNDLDNIIVVVIPNPKERSNWIKSLKESLPEQKKQ